MKRHFLWFFAILFCFKIDAQEISNLAKTPPMGWNSWDSYGMDITDKEMQAIADFMAKKLKKYGYEYVVLDMGWYYGEGLNTNNFRMDSPPQYIDEWGRLIPSPEKFPSAANGKGLKPLGDYIHSKGLKFGIHIMRGIPWQAVEQNTPIKGTKYRAKDIATDVASCTWYHGPVSIDMTKPGAQEYYNSIFEMYAEWGVDFVKADDILKHPFRQSDIEGVRSAIDKTGRPMVLSLSAGPVPTEHADALKKNANMWRISGDMWDHWSYLEKTFVYCREWQDFIIPGHWPDCDMLPLGKLRINGTDGMLAKSYNLKNEETFNEFSRFTEDEKYTHMTLWSIFRSPLMMGGDLLQLDDLTFSLLTNEEVLAVNQNSINNKELRATEKDIVWTASDPKTGARYLAIFNVSEKVQDISVSWEELNISGVYKIRDLWVKKNLGKAENKISVQLNPHGCKLFKLYQ